MLRVTFRVSTDAGDGCRADRYLALAALAGRSRFCQIDHRPQESRRGGAVDTGREGPVRQSASSDQRRGMMFQAVTPVRARLRG